MTRLLVTALTMNIVLPSSDFFLMRSLKSFKLKTYCYHKYSDYKITYKNSVLLSHDNILKDCWQCSSSSNILNKNKSEIICFTEANEYELQCYISDNSSEHKLNLHICRSWSRVDVIFFPLKNVRVLLILLILIWWRFWSIHSEIKTYSAILVYGRSS